MNTEDHGLTYDHTEAVRVVGCDECKARAERAEAALAVARQALDYCSYPSVGFPGGGGAAYDIFVRTSASELNARAALAASAHCARAALSRLDEEAK